MLLTVLSSGVGGQIIDTRIPLNYNFHGMAHQGEAVTGAPNTNADVVLYRSMSDRGLYWDPAAPDAIGTAPLIGATGVPYALFNTLGYGNTTSISQAAAAANALDMVHIGYRGVFYRVYDALGTTSNGPFPPWAPDAATNADHTGDLTTVLSSAVTVDAASEIGVIYQGSDSGGQFDVVLTFNNGSTDTNVTARVACPDWFGNAADAAIVSGQPVSSQKKLTHVNGSTTYTTFQGVSAVDSANLNAFSTTNAGPNLNVTEAVISVPAIIAAGNNVAGQQLTRITFRNASYPTRAITTLTGNGTVATATTSGTHGFIVGTPITIAGASVAGLNGTFVIASVPTTTTFTYANSTIAASTTGTRTVFGVGINRGYAVFAATVRSGSPANSSCATAFPIGAGTFVGTNAHSLGTQSSGFGTNDTSAVWYAYTAPNSGLVDVRTCGSAIDTTLVIYDGCGGTVVGSNDNGCGLASRVQFTSVSGHTYYVRAAGNNGVTGNFSFSLEDPAHVDITMPLQFNWNGICHGVTEQTLPTTGQIGSTNENRSNLNGFRAIADRGLLCDGIQSDALNFGGTIGYQGMVYNVYSTPLQSDMIHLGNRDLAAGGIRAWSLPGTTWPAGGGTSTSQNGLAPLWLNNSDQTGPQTSSMTALNAVFGASTKLGILYHMSNVDTISGTTPRPAFFDVTLGFTDSSTVTVTIQATDWFGTNTQVLPAPTSGSGLEVQRVLGIYHAIQNTDMASDAGTGGRLKVMEAVISSTELNNHGFNPVGKTLSSVTFSNMRSGNPAQDSIYSALGIYSATLRDPATFNLNFGPAATGTVDPNLLTVGATGKMTVNVSRGSGSPNNIATVVVDGSAAGLGSITLNDSGTAGDAHPNDNIWSRDIRFPVDTVPGAFSLPFTVTDGQSRTATGNIIFTLVAPTGSITPSTVVVNTSARASVVLSPNTGGAADITSVVFDGSPVGLGTIALNDSGLNGDTTANDGRWSGTFTVPVNAAAGLATLPFTITDASARQAFGTASVTVVTPPVAYSDLGDLSSPNCAGIGFDLAGADVIWLKFSLSTAVSAAANNFLDIDTHGSSGCVDTEIGLYDAGGNLIATDDNNGSGSESLLSFGLAGRAAFTDGSCGSASVAYDGQNGSLAAGTYYLAVGRFNTTFNNTFWSVTSTGATSLGVNVNLCSQIPNRPPQGVGAANPATVVEGLPTQLTVVVTPGSNPVSSGISVIGDASALGGSGSETFYDDGTTNGDLVAGDGVFTTSVIAAAALGAHPVNFTVSDAQGRSSNGTFNVTVSASPTGACCGAGGVCTIDRQFPCTNGGGTFQGGGTNCGGGAYSFSQGGNAFEDISATGTVISATPGDDAVFNVALSFPFTFYGAVYNDVNVSTNGNLQFPPSASTTFTNVGIPNAAVPNNMMAVLWDDLNFNVNSNDNLQHETRGTSGIDLRQIFQWTNVAQFSAAADTDFNTFQVALYEDGHFEFRYATISGDFSAIGGDTGGATVGIEDLNGGPLSVQYATGATPVTSDTNLSISSAVVPSPCDPCSRADFNHDGDRNPDDLGDFITCYFGEVSAPGNCPAADFNGDNDINPDDLGDFITLYFSCV